MMMERLAQWGRDNKERLKEYQYEYNKKGVENLSPSYLNSIFKKVIGLDPKEHPKLLEAYRNYIFLKRKINEKPKDASDLKRVKRIK
jgi:hypothetical protein